MPRPGSRRPRGTRFDLGSTSFHLGPKCLPLGRGLCSRGKLLDPRSFTPLPSLVDQNASRRDLSPSVNTSSSMGAVRSRHPTSASPIDSGASSLASPSRRSRLPPLTNHHVFFSSASRCAAVTLSAQRTGSRAPSGSRQRRPSARSALQAPVRASSPSSPPAWPLRAHFAECAKLVCSALSYRARFFFW